MPMRMAVLGSGSGGNSTLVEFPDDDDPFAPRRRILIDAGLSPRETARRLATFRVRLDQISDILITHLDLDHLRPGWRKACIKHRIRLRLSRRHHRRLHMRFDLGDRAVPFDDDETLQLCGAAGVCAQAVPLAHDQLGSCGFVIEHDGERLGFATDLGRVSPGLFETFHDLDFLAIESNYDRDMQVRSLRPAFLKRRVMGGAGHLSNTQALDAVLRIALQSQLRHVVLLHLSRECNDPECIESLYAERAPALLPHLTITNQFDPTPMLSSRDAAVIELKEPQRMMPTAHETLWSMVG